VILNNLNIAALESLSDEEKLEAIQAIAATMGLKSIGKDIKFPTFESNVPGLVNARMVEISEIDSSEKYNWISRNKQGSYSIPDDAKFAQWFDSENDLLIPQTPSKNKSVFLYKDGWFQEMDGDGLGKVIIETIQSIEPSLAITLTKINALTQMIYKAAKNNNYDYDAEICSDYIVFKDKTLNINTWKYEPHSPKHRAFSAIPFNAPDLEKEIYCPKYQAMLDWLSEEDADTKEMILQFLGATISQIDLGHRRASLLFVGAHGSGKSSLINVQRKILGDDNFAAMNFSALSKDNFESAELYHKRIGLFSDMDYQRADDINMFKQLSGGDPISGNKKYGAKFKFTFRGLLIMVSNTPPVWGGDKGRGLYERLFIVHVHNALKEMNSEIIQEIVEEEVEGVMLLQLMALKEFMKTMTFKQGEKQIAARNFMYVNNDELIKFFMDTLTFRNSEGEEAPTWRHEPTIQQLFEVSQRYLRKKGVTFKYTKSLFETRLKDWIIHKGGDEEYIVVNRARRYLKEFKFTPLQELENEDGI
jgi:P4 family phage/plasmid primase-like protien